MIKDFGCHLGLQIIVPPGYTDLHKSLVMELNAFNEDSCFVEIPKAPGLYSLNNTVVYSIPLTNNGLHRAKGKIASKYSSGQPLSDKKVYITRGLSGENDRIANYDEL